MYKTAPPEKLLPQFDCTTCLEILWKGSSNLLILKSNLFSLDNCAKSNFKKISSLTMGSERNSSYSFNRIFLKLCMCLSSSARCLDVISDSFLPFSTSLNLVILGLKHIYSGYLVNPTPPTILPGSF